MRLFSADKAQLKAEAEAWNNAMTLRSKAGWWNEQPFADFTSGSQDWLSQRMYADTNRLMMAPERVELWHWRPEGGAVAVRISEHPNKSLRNARFTVAVLPVRLVPQPSHEQVGAAPTALGLSCGPHGRDCPNRCHQPPL